MRGARPGLVLWLDDGVRKSIDEPPPSASRRVARAHLSKVNVGRYEALRADGQMNPAGERAYEENKQRTGVYAYENIQKELSREEIARFRRDKAAWADWEKRPPGYRKVVLHWINSAKKPETRERRLATLIADSAAGRKIAGVDISRKKAGP